MTGKNAHLYVVATPIGNLGDISQRALDTLRQVDLIAAEDTRHSRKLLAHYGIDTPMQPLHEHNEERQVPRLLAHLQSGRSLALISDAGTPLLSDPGYRLISAAHDAAIQPVPVPGASALAAMLSVAGLPVDHFVFEGFLPAKPAARAKRLAALTGETRSLVFYESSHRILDSLRAMQAAFGDHRFCSIGRELTKRHESIYRGELATIVGLIEDDGDRQRGEFVIVVQGTSEDLAESETAGRRIIDILLEELPVGQAAQLAARISGAPKRHLYDYAIKRTDAGR